MKEEEEQGEKACQSLPAAASANSCEKDPCDREIATLNPPPQYYNSFHKAWLERIGEGGFEVDRDSLRQKRNDDGFRYFCLWVKPTGYKFPVQTPHLSLGKYKFLDRKVNWKACIQCQAYLWKREAQAQFTNYGKGTKFWSWKAMSSMPFRRF